MYIAGVLNSESKLGTNAAVRRLSNNYSGSIIAQLLPTNRRHNISDIGTMVRRKQQSYLDRCVSGSFSRFLIISDIGAAVRRKQLIQLSNNYSG